MKRGIVLFVLILSLTGISQPSAMEVKNPLPFQLGENLEYKLAYGWFTVGKAQLSISPEKLNYSGEDCYKVDISGKTAGLLGVFAKVDDLWGAYVNQKDLLPLYAYSDINEGKYQRKDKILFDHETGKIQVDKIRKQKTRPTKYYDIKEMAQVFDLISGYLYLRSVDYSKLNKGDTISIDAFYDEIFYDFKVVYKGTELLKTKVGDINSYKLMPIMPENEVFSGQTPVTAWLSADSNQLPLKIEADMWFGSAYCELVSYKNVRFSPDFN